MTEFPMYLINTRNYETKDSAVADLLEAAKLALFELTHDGNSKMTIDMLRTAIGKIEKEEK